MYDDLDCSFYDYGSEIYFNHLLLTKYWSCANYEYFSHTVGFGNWSIELHNRIIIYHTYFHDDTHVYLKPYRYIIAIQQSNQVYSNVQ